MINLAYFAAAVGFAYFVGRKSAGIGVAAFLLSVAIHQVAVDGPHSFIEPSGCDYGIHARIC